MWLKLAVSHQRQKLLRSRLPTPLQHWFVYLMVCIMWDLFIKKIALYIPYLWKDSQCWKSLSCFNNWPVIRKYLIQQASQTSELQPLEEQTSSFDHHIWQPQTQRSGGFSDRDAGCQGWKMLRCQWYCFPMQCLSCLLTGAFDPDALAPFLLLLRPRAFSTWNRVHVLAVCLPWTRCAHFDIVTTWHPLIFTKWILTATVLCSKQHLSPESIWVLGREKEHLHCSGCQEKNLETLCSFPIAHVCLSCLLCLSISKVL